MWVHSSAMAEDFEGFVRFAEQAAAAERFELTPVQRRFAESVERGESVVISCGRSGGRRCIAEFFRRYAEGRR